MAEPGKNVSVPEGESVLPVDISSSHVTVAAVTAEPGDKVSALEGESSENAQASGFFAVTLNLTQVKQKIQFPLTAADFVLDVRQFINDMPSNFLTCFKMEINGIPLNNQAVMGTVEGFGENCVIDVVPDLYTEREVRIHVRRFLELVYSSRTDYQNAQPLNTTDCFSPSLLAGVIQGAPTIDKSASVNTPDLASIFMNENRNASAPSSCLKCLTYSTYNPPAGNRTLQGDILYLRVVTVTDEIIHITASSHGFFLNRSTDVKFDHREKKGKGSHTLVQCLEACSPQFKTNFAKLLSSLSSTTRQLEIMPTPYRVTPWTAPGMEHYSDASRAEDALYRWSETDLKSPGVLRDWNEDWQVFHELPQVTIQDNILRTRNIFKLNSEYVATAVRGAQAVILGNVPPMNPQDEPAAHMFLWNNIFFSFANDSRGIYQHLGGDEAAHALSGNEMKSLNILSNGYVPGLFTLETVIIDYLGRRVMAQGLLPGILRKDLAATVVYGTNDIDKTMACDENFNTLLGKAAPSLHIKSHKVAYPAADGKAPEDNTSESTVAAPAVLQQTYLIHSSIEVKGITGTDGRAYALDLNRTAPPDCNFLEKDGVADDNGPFRHKVYLLRHGLVNLYAEAKYNEAAKKLIDLHNEKYSIKDEASLASTETKVDLPATTSIPGVEGSSSEKNQVDLSSIPPFLLNPDVFSTTVLADSKEQIEQDENDVRAVCAYLVEVVIPRLVSDLVDGRLNCLDGAALRDILHSRGIGMRYLGMITTLCKANLKTPYSYIVTLHVSEMIARAAKFHLRRVLRNASIDKATLTVATFLNTFLGNAVETGGKSQGKKTGAEDVLPFPRDQVKTLFWQDICATVKKHFRFTISANVISEYSISKLSLLRSLCLKVGVQVVAKKYDMDSILIAPFQCADILNIVPIVKHVVPQITSGDYCLDLGIKHSRTHPKEAIELLERANEIFQQTFGFVHTEVALCYRVLAQVYAQLNQPLLAVTHMERATTLAERLYGLDHFETIANYLQLGLYLQLAKEIPKAIACLQHARLLASTIFGVRHPEYIHISTTLAGVYLDMELPNLAIPVLLDVQINQTFLSLERSVHSAHVLLLLGHAYKLNKEYRKAVQAASTVHDFFCESYGKDHEASKNAMGIYSKFVEEAIQEERKLKKGAKTPAAHLIKASDPEVTIHKPQQESSGGTGTEKTIDELVAFINADDWETGGEKKKKKAPKKA